MRIASVAAHTIIGREAARMRFRVKFCRIQAIPGLQQAPA